MTAVLKTVLNYRVVIQPTSVNKERNASMKAKHLLATILVMLSFNCVAAPAKKALIEEMFRLTDMNKLLDSVYAQTDAMMKKSFQSMQVSEAQKPILNQYAEKSMVIMKEEMSWDSLKAPIVEAYASVYSEEELKDIILFYKTPTGQKVLKKMPELMQVTMSLTQKKIQAMMPKMQRLQKDLEAELAKGGAK